MDLGVSHEPSPQDRDLIIGTMRRWLDGEPVPPHDEIISRWGSAFRMYRDVWASGERVEHLDFSRSIVLRQLRQEAINEFGFMIPCKELLDSLESHQPIVEIGAGTGFMTVLMRSRGIDVIGTDIGRRYYPFETGCHDPMQVELEGKTAVRHYRDRTVFCSWPSLNETWCRQALRAMRIGQRAIIVEEDCCAEESTWEYRDVTFERIAQVPLPAWHYMNDRAAVWIKKRQRALR